MISIDNTLVSENLLDIKFICDLNACKGACCIEGDSGAPLEEEEASIIDDIYEVIKPFMTQEGIASIEEQGKYIIDTDGDLVTPLIDGKECAYVIFEKGIAKCAIEKAYLEKKIQFKKPISCHLYPVRINKYKDYDAVNYHQWDICKEACNCGSELNIKVYQFLKEPLIRKYGKEWFTELKLHDEHNMKNKET